MKWTALCEDETFHPAVCLVAIEAASNFIVLEEYAESRRKAISKKSEELLSIVGKRAGPLCGYGEDRKNLLERAARECADFFQRSSSCVEGRNAQLSLRHHGIHILSEARLMALTVVQNFHVKRPDGTTPAQRFLEAEHADLSEWLVENMDYPAQDLGNAVLYRHKVKWPMLKSSPLLWLVVDSAAAWRNADAKRHGMRSHAKRRNEISNERPNQEPGPATAFTKLAYSGA